MSLTLFNGGRFLSFPETVDLLNDEQYECFALAGVFSDLWRQGLIVRNDRFRYSVEAAGSHIHQSLEIWANKHGRGHKHYSDGWYLMMTLKTSFVEVSQKNGSENRYVGVQGSPPVHTEFEGLVPEPGGSCPPPFPCSDCDFVNCDRGCKRVLNR